MKEIKIKKKEI